MAWICTDSCVNKQTYACVIIVHKQNGRSAIAKPLPHAMELFKKWLTDFFFKGFTNHATIQQTENISLPITISSTSEVLFLGKETTLKTMWTLKLEHNATGYRWEQVNSAIFSEILIDLRWLLFHICVEFKMLVLTFKALKCLGTTYLLNYLSWGGGWCTVGGGWVGGWLVVGGRMEEDGAPWEWAGCENYVPRLRQWVGGWHAMGGRLGGGWCAVEEGVAESWCATGGWWATGCFAMGGVRKGGAMEGLGRIVLELPKHFGTSESGCARFWVFWWSRTQLGSDHPESNWAEFHRLAHP